MAEPPRSFSILTSLRLAPAQSAAFNVMIQGTAIVAGLTHLAFLILFHKAGVEFMAMVNVASVLCYVCAFLLAYRGHMEACILLIGVEVLAHALLASWVIGWNSGFHFYILLVIPVVVIANLRSMAVKVTLVSALTVLYLGMDMLLLRRPPLVPLADAVIDGLHYFNVLCTILILIFLAGYYQHLIAKAETKLRLMATTDPLTRLSNRRAMIEAIGEEEQRVRRAHTPLSFVLCDLDHFKQVNDTYGHDAGDQVLKAVSGVLTEGVREVDHVARWGGEEFLLVLPAAGLQEAQQVAERLREGVAALCVKAGARRLRVSMTCGVTMLHPGESSEQAIGRADQALYEGKHAGRNRVVLGTHTPVPMPQA